LISADEKLRVFFKDQTLNAIQKELHFKNTAAPTFAYNDGLSESSDIFNKTKKKNFLL